jgi:hypothetical protein
MENKNPSLNNHQTLEDAIKTSGFHYAKPISAASTDKWAEHIRKFMRKEPVMVIDLHTLKLRPSKYQ